MLTASERVILLAELTNDPLVRGYASKSASQVVTDIRDTLYRSRIKARMDSSSVFQAIDVTEFNALTDAKQRNVLAILAFGSVNPQGKEATLFSNYFGANSTTITALQSARLESISRAVELGIPNVHEIDVIAVRGG